MPCAGSPPTSRTTSRPSSAVADLDIAGGHIEDGLGRIVGVHRPQLRPGTGDRPGRGCLNSSTSSGTGDDARRQGPPGPGPGAVLVGSALFAPLDLRSLRLQHRGWVSPMCQYSCDPETGEGVPTRLAPDASGLLCHRGSGPGPHRGRRRQRRGQDQPPRRRHLQRRPGRRRGNASRPSCTATAPRRPRSAPSWRTPAGKRPPTGRSPASRARVPRVRGRLGHRGSWHRRFRRLRAAVGA